MNRATTEQALQRLANDAERIAAPDVLMALVTVGDAMRLGLEIPKAVRGWMVRLQLADVEAALAPIAVEVAQWSSRNDGEAPTVRRREEVDSAWRAAMRIAMPKGWAPTSIPSLDILRRAVARPDGQRMEGGDGDDPIPASDEDRPGVPPSSIRESVPDDEIVVAYARRGALARYVEAVAEQNAEFAAELEATVDLLASEPEGVSAAAQAWRARCAARAVGAPSGASSSGSAHLIALEDGRTGVTTVRRWHSAYVWMALAASLLLVLGAVYALGADGRKAREAQRQAEVEREVAAKEAELRALQEQLSASSVDAATSPDPSEPRIGSAACGGCGGGLLAEIGGHSTTQRPADAGAKTSFDSVAAKEAIQHVDVRSCKTPDGPVGEGHVTLTFGPDGDVLAVTVDSPRFAATPVGRCVQGRYRSVRVPAFSGDLVRVGQAFRVD